MARYEYRVEVERRSYLVPPQDWAMELPGATPVRIVLHGADPDPDDSTAVPAQAEDTRLLLGFSHGGTLAYGRGCAKRTR